MPIPDTRSARQAILGALRNQAPRQPLPAPDLQPYLQGPYGQGSQGPRPAPAGLLESFERAARGWHADLLHAPVQGWADAVQQALAQRGCRRVVIGAGSPLLPELSRTGLPLQRYEQAIEHWKTELFDEVDAGVTSAAAGIADTGSLLLLTGPQEPRTLSLVPPVHVAVLRASRLYASLPAVLAELAPQRDLPTNLLLVTGPSKTADIQQTLAYGAHGPKELVIVLVHDLEEEMQ
ncbi:MAG: hypothetical protein RJA36_2793 [Pseudomonadota bacterium]|jgi:L-lactate dehydrogenase complex protein LldG